MEIAHDVQLLIAAIVGTALTSPSSGGQIKVVVNVQKEFARMLMPLDSSRNIGPAHTG